VHRTAGAIRGPVREVENQSVRRARLKAASFRDQGPVRGAAMGSRLGRGTIMTLRRPIPIDRGLMLQAAALLAFAVVFGIFVHWIIPLLAD
jgi:hypothetical protein